jgi:hypothetical protein
VGRVIYCWFTLPLHEPGWLSDGFVQVFLAAGLSFRSTPVFAQMVSDAPTVHVAVFFAETVLPKEGASAMARTAATPIARNIVFVFITLDGAKYYK